MSFSLDQILPSIQALGILGYWLIGLGSMLVAFFLTGVVVPGTLIVDAGGILVQLDLLDLFDLAWFVAIGSVLGSELSDWTGKLAMNRLPGRRRIGGSAAFARAKGLFEKRGGMALVIGRFLGPVAGLVPLAAAMAGKARVAAFAVALGLTVLAPVNVWHYDHPRNAPVQIAEQILSDAAALTEIGLPSRTESLIGSPVHPVSLVYVARDEVALSDAVLASGWTASRQPKPGLVSIPYSRRSSTAKIQRSRQSRTSGVGSPTISPL